ncbi:hypothetical protein VP01_3985g1 [Puccinia sorghi]|uniref:Uncharacterized protein n=1 Tax=Puccinia sorghi TaxID=27349 RepID=A0A0L6UT27_9BASI|nr:hypothetical protein VP01_3985g1 [Puccinia sorghi]
MVLMLFSGAMNNRVLTGEIGLGFRFIGHQQVGEASATPPQVSNSARRSSTTPTSPLGDTTCLKAQPEYTSKLKQVTTFIRLHLGRKDSTCFVDDLDTYDPKALWDSISTHYAAKSVENAANVMEKLHDIIFVEGEMQKSINLFCQTFHLMLEVSNKQFDKKTLEAVRVFLVIKRLPPSFSVFCTLKFASFKDPDTQISMSSFLTDLELELRLTHTSRPAVSTPGFHFPSEEASSQGIRIFPTPWCRSLSTSRKDMLFFQLWTGMNLNAKKAPISWLMEKLLTMCSSFG